MTTLFWHDYETFGADPRCDRPAQFAGIRTDENLRVIGKPVTVYCKPAPDFLPHPDACVLTGITPQQAWDLGVCEAEFAARVHEELAKSHTCGVGYNSIRFDDEMTRYLLYRNLYSPYDREWRNGNSRWDIIDLARMAYALRPDGINWPNKEDGTPSFKLEHLSAANDLTHESAHDALSDVYATIALAKLIRKHQARLYDFLFTLRDKRRVAEYLNLRQPKPVLHTSRMYPAQFGCTTLVVPLAAEPRNKNGIIVYDLRVDPTPLLELDADAIRERVFTSAEALNEARIPLKVVPLSTLSNGAHERMQIDIAECEHHWQQIQAAPADALAAKIEEAFKPPAFPPAPEAEAMLYDAFIADADKAKMDIIRSMSPKALATYKPNFLDKRLPELLWRYRARNYPDTLNAQEQKAWEEYRQNRLLKKEAGASIVADEYFKRIAELRAEVNAEKQGILDALDAYGQMIL